MRRSRQPTGSGLYSISSSALASWGRQLAGTQCSWRPLSRPPWTRRGWVPAGKRQRSLKPFCF